VVERAVVAFPEAPKRRFPEAKPAIDLGLESYLAICLHAADGTHLGRMAVMDAGRMQAGDDDVAAMRIFASRAAAEVERRHQSVGASGATCTTVPRPQPARASSLPAPRVPWRPAARLAPMSDRRGTLDRRFVGTVQCAPSFS
jgi:hypothetical protein